MNYLLGVSFNCYVGEESIGDGDERDVAFIGNDKQKLIEATIKSELSYPLIYTEDHVLVGNCSNVGGIVIGVFTNFDDLEYPVAVLVEEPIYPTII